MTTVMDWAFWVGAGVAIVIVPLSMSLIRASEPPPWFARLATVLGAAVSVAFVCHWIVWWFAFDYIGDEPVPNKLFPLTTVLMTASAVGCLFLAAGVGFTRVRQFSRGSGERST